MIGLLKAVCVSERKRWIDSMNICMNVEQVRRIVYKNEWWKFVRENAWGKAQVMKVQL